MSEIEENSSKKDDSQTETGEPTASDRFSFEKQSHEDDIRLRQDEISIKREALANDTKIKLILQINDNIYVCIRLGS